jgi:Tol biopolymer transport system component
LGENTSPDLENLQPLANSHLILFNLERVESQSLTLQEDLEDTAPSFSPDGAYLAFARKSLHRDSWKPGRQLWIMRTGTWQAEALTDDAVYNHFAFAWSPLGDMLAYVRFNQSVLSEPPELWVMDPFSGLATQLIIGGHSPQWIP